MNSGVCSRNGFFVHSWTGTGRFGVWVLLPGSPGKVPVSQCCRKDSGAGNVIFLNHSQIPNFDTTPLLFTLHSLAGTDYIEGIISAACSAQSNKWLPALVNGQEEPQAFNQFQSFLLQIFYQELIPIINKLWSENEENCSPLPWEIAIQRSPAFPRDGSFCCSGHAEIWV